MGKPSLQNIPALTGLRGIAALMVAVLHFTQFCIRFVMPDQTRLIDKSYLMVDLFFIMSGFLILHIYQHKFCKKVAFKAYKNFLLTRFARVYPLHLFVLLTMVALYYLVPTNKSIFFDPSAILQHIFLLQSLPIGNQLLTWNFPSWSISAEWWSYIMFPILCLILLKNKRIGVPVIILCVIISYFLILYYVPIENSENSLDTSFGFGFLRGIAAFMTGMLVYLLYQLNWIKKIFSGDIAAVIYLIIFTYIFHIGISDIWVIPGFSLLILFLTSNQGKISMVFNNKLIDYLGEISYSIYMIHFLLIIFLKKVHFMGYTYEHQIIVIGYKGALACFIYLLILIALSTLSYYLVERPSRNYIRAIANKKAIQ